MPGGAANAGRWTGQAGMSGRGGTGLDHGLRGEPPDAWCTWEQGMRARAGREGRCAAGSNGGGTVLCSHAGGVVASGRWWCAWAHRRARAAHGRGGAELSRVRGGRGARGPAAPSQLVAVRGRTGRGREKRKEEKEREKEEEKKKERERKKRKRKGGAGHEPVAASTRSDTHVKRGEQEKN